ncbi:MAG: PmoA family protein [Verrucomicrobiales bacterium]|nr:PmoA family protein [Verrucomicrobiales bacterium]
MINTVPSGGRRLAAFGLALLSGLAANAQPQPVTARMENDTVVVEVAGTPFTHYRFAADQKYPYFFPVNGPASGRTITVHQTEPYPHHSSIFFGCDRVNGGNYWQEGNDRGQIVPLKTRLVQAAGEAVVIEQHCRWQRPGAPAPFEDSRRITIKAPAPDRRTIEFDVTWNPLIDVNIQRNNHALFSARLAPDLCVKGGGTLVNAAGDSGEQDTFGKVSPWMDYSGERDGVREGLAILSHPANRWHPPQWFTRDYGFFSPTPMNWLPDGGLNLKPGETIRLRYLAVVHRGPLDRESLDHLLADWVKGKAGAGQAP